MWRARQQLRGVVTTTEREGAKPHGDAGRIGRSGRERERDQPSGRDDRQGFLTVPGRNRKEHWNIEERRVEVERLAVKGWSERRIARHLGLSKTTIHNDLEAVGDELRKSQLENAEKVRAVELEKLADCEAAALQTITAVAKLAGTDPEGEDAFSGELTLKAIDRVVRIQERRAKLLGLDSPERIDATLSEGPSPAQAARLVREAFRTEDTPDAGNGSGCQGDAPAAADGDG